MWLAWRLNDDDGSVGWWWWWFFGTYMYFALRANDLYDKSIAEYSDMAWDDQWWASWYVDQAPTTVGWFLWLWLICGRLAIVGGWLRLNGLMKYIYIYLHISPTATKCVCFCLSVWDEFSPVSEFLFHNSVSHSNRQTRTLFKHNPLTIHNSTAFYTRHIIYTSDTLWRSLALRGRMIWQTTN